MRRITGCWLTAALLLAPGAPGPLGAQDAAQDRPTLQEGLRFFQQQEYDRAIRVLEAVIEKEPENAWAWAYLGLSYHSKEEWSTALRYHRRAAEFEATRPQALYNAGAAHARLGDPDSAFHWLGRAQATGRVNMTNVGMDPDLESLRGDSRWNRFFPSDEASIIHEWRGEAEGDQYGTDVRRLRPLSPGDRPPGAQITPP